MTYTGALYSRQYLPDGYLPISGWKDPVEYTVEREIEGGAGIQTRVFMLQFGAPTLNNQDCVDCGYAHACNGTGGTISWNGTCPPLGSDESWLFSGTNYVGDILRYDHTGFFNTNTYLWVIQAEHDIDLGPGHIYEGRTPPTGVDAVSTSESADLSGLFPDPPNPDCLIEMDTAVAPFQSMDVVIRSQQIGATPAAVRFASRDTTVDMSSHRREAVEALPELFTLSGDQSVSRSYDPSDADAGGKVGFYMAGTDFLAGNPPTAFMPGQGGYPDGDVYAYRALNIFWTTAAVYRTSRWRWVSKQRPSLRRRQHRAGTLQGPALRRRQNDHASTAGVTVRRRQDSNR